MAAKRVPDLCVRVRFVITLSLAILITLKTQQPSHMCMHALHAERRSVVVGIAHALAQSLLVALTVTTGDHTAAQVYVAGQRVCKRSDGMFSAYASGRPSTH